MALIETLVDDFDDDSIDTVRWPGNYGGVAEVGGRARVDCDTAQWSGYASASSYTLAGSQVSCRIYPPAAGGATDTAYASLLLISSTAGTDVGALIDVVSSGLGAFLGLVVRVGYSDPAAVYLPYSATDHAWIRVHESAGALYWDTSADGLTWTNRRTAVSPAWVADADLRLVLEAHRGSGTDDFAEFDSLNARVAGNVTVAFPALSAAVAGIAATTGTVSTSLPALTTATAGGVSQLAALSIALPAMSAALTSAAPTPGVLTPGGTSVTLTAAGTQPVLTPA